MVCVCDLPVGQLLPGRDRCNPAEKGGIYRGLPLIPVWFNKMLTRYSPQTGASGKKHKLWYDFASFCEAKPLKKD